jgi:hypothetical protein
LVRAVVFCEQWPDPETIRERSVCFIAQSFDQLSSIFTNCSTILAILARFSAMTFSAFLIYFEQFLLIFHPF